MKFFNDLKKIKATDKELRQFGVRGGIVLAFVGSFLLWRESHAFLFFYVMSLYNVLGVFFPAVLRPLHKAIFAIVLILGTVVTYGVMCLAFYLIFTPVGLMGRLFRKNFLDVRFDKSATSYWIKREKTSFTPAELENQF
jgi:hypothetical protein